MDIQTIKQNLNLMLNTAERAGAKFHKAGKGFSSCCPIHGGDNPNAFSVWTGSEGDVLYHCFTHAECGSGDIIKLTMKLNNCDRQTALQTLGGDSTSFMSRPIVRQAKPIGPKPLPPAERQAEMLEAMEKNAARLFDPAGQASRVFLRKRKIYKSTVELFNIGFAMRPQRDDKGNVTCWRPAISIPWYDTRKGIQQGEGTFYENKVMLGIKYRYIDDKAGKYDGFAGNNLVLFGLWDMLETNRTLLLTEGELNMLSAWQLRPKGVNVLSFGDEKAWMKNIDILRGVAAKHDRVFIWADDIWHKDKENAGLLESLCKGSGKAFQSPKTSEGVKEDMNQLLQAGTLPAVLSSLLGVECETFHPESLIE